MYPINRLFYKPPRHLLFYKICQPISTFSPLAYNHSKSLCLNTYTYKPQCKQHDLHLIRSTVPKKNNICGFEYKLSYQYS